MTRGRALTAVGIGAMVVVLIIVLVREASRGPTFRAADHDSYEECVAAIPPEWTRGGLDWTRAEAACGFEHRRRLERSSR